MNRYSACIAPTLLALATLVATPAFAAGNAKKEISTAIEHAGFASKVKTTAGVHLHLHHVVNCLVGPQGVGFYAKAGNPCKGQGNGALNDLKGHAAVRHRLDTALHEAKMGLKEDDFRAARAKAIRIRKILKAAKAEY